MTKPFDPWLKMIVADLMKTDKQFQNMVDRAAIRKTPKERAKLRKLTGLKTLKRD